MGEATAPGTSVACPACTGVLSDRALRRRGAVYRLCPHCRSGTLVPAPSSDAVEELYGEAYFREGAAGGYLDYEADEASHRSNAVRRLRLVERRGSTQRGRLLDIGCGVGFLLAEAERRGWSATGVDRSSWARERALRRFGYRVQRESRQLVASQPAPFDCITLCQIVEHAHQPSELLDTCRVLIASGGTLMIETWNRDAWPARLLGRHWHQVNPPTVLHLFTLRGLEALLERTGFRMLSVHRPFKRLRLDQALHALLGPERPLGLPAGIARIPLLYRAADLVQVLAVVR